MPFCPGIELRNQNGTPPFLSNQIAGHGGVKNILALQKTVLLVLLLKQLANVREADYSLLSECGNLFGVAT